jgi:hypothetical protein
MIIVLPILHRFLYEGLTGTVKWSVKGNDDSVVLTRLAQHYYADGDALMGLSKPFVQVRMVMMMIVGVVVIMRMVVRTIMIMMMVVVMMMIMLMLMLITGFALPGA